MKDSKYLRRRWKQNQQWLEQKVEMNLKIKGTGYIPKESCKEFRKKPKICSVEIIKTLNLVKRANAKSVVQATLLEG